MKPSRNWNAVGRALRQLDPGRYAEVVSLVDRIVATLVDPMSQPLPPGVGAPPEAPKPSRSQQRALKRRAGFRVIDGGLAGTVRP